MIFLFICWELHIFIHHILIISVDYYLPLSPNAFMLSPSQLYLVCVVINTNTHIQLLLSTHECGATQRSMNDLLETSSQRGVTLSPLATIHCQFLLCQGNHTALGYSSSSMLEFWLFRLPPLVRADVCNRVIHLTDFCTSQVFLCDRMLAFTFLCDASPTH